MTTHGKSRFVMQRVKDAWLSSTGRLRASISFRSTAKRPTRSPHSNTFHQCRETPLSIFIDCIVDHNLQSLIRYGRPTESQIQQAWDELYQEYCDLSGGSSYKLLVSLANDIATIDRKITHIQICLRVLSMTDSVTCAGILRKYGYKYAFDRSRPAEFRADLDRVFNKAKVFEVVLSQKVAQREKLISQIPKGGEITREYFDRVLVDLAKHQGYRLDSFTITVGEYCHIKGAYEREIEYMNKQAEKYKK